MCPCLFEVPDDCLKAVFVASLEEQLLPICDPPKHDELQGWNKSVSWPEKNSRWDTSKLKQKLTISIITSKHPLELQNMRGFTIHIQMLLCCCSFQPEVSQSVEKRYSQHQLFSPPLAVSHSTPKCCNWNWSKFIPTAMMENDQLDVPELPGPWRRRSCCFPWESHRWTCPAESSAAFRHQASPNARPAKYLPN